VETIRALRRVAASELSLDAPIDRGDRDSASFGERFAGDEAIDIEEQVEAQARREFLDRMFERYLTERERRILYLYYGLDDGEERTLEEIGSLLGVTRERIRQIRNRAFEKLRESPDGEARAGFWAASGAGRRSAGVRRRIRGMEGGAGPSSPAPRHAAEHREASPCHAGTDP